MELVTRALEEGGGDHADGFLLLLSALRKDQVPPEIARLWQQGRVMVAALDVMWNEMCELMGETDPSVRTLLG